MKRPKSVAVALLVASISAFCQPPAIGAKFKKEWALGKDRTLCMTHPAQLDPCVERTVDGIKYQIAYSEQTHRVSYLFTSDDKFRTVDGLKVGDSIPVSKQTVRTLPGWQIRAPMTRDGWWPIVGYDLPQIKLNDGTVLDLAHKNEQASGTATIVGFAKGRP